MEDRRVYSEGQLPTVRTLPLSLFYNQENILSARQLQELNASVLQYLRPILKSTPETYDIVKEKLDELGTSNQENTNKYSSLMVSDIPDNYLQKKWSTVLRLQRNIQDLEIKNNALIEKNNELNKTIDELNTNLLSIGATNSLSIPKLNWIPSIIKSTLRYHTSPITSVVIHPFNPYLITASQDGMMVFWNMLDFAEPLNHIKNAHFKSINKLIFKPNSSILISCSSDQIIKLWDLSTNIESVKTPIKIFTGHEHIVSSLAVSNKESNILFSCSRDKSIKIWDSESGWTLHTINAHSDWVRSIDATGEFIISCSSDTSIRLTYWPTQTGIGLCLGHKQVIEDVKFFPKSSNQYLDKLIEADDNNDSDDLEYDKLGFKYAVSCGRDKLIKIWKLPLPAYNTTNGNPIVNTLNPYGKCIKEIKGHKSWVRNLQVHYNGKYLISCSDDQTIKIWDLDSLKNIESDIEPIKTLDGHQSFVNTITMATSPSNDDLNDDNTRCYLVSGGADNLINVWV